MKRPVKPCLNNFAPVRGRYAELLSCARRSGRSQVPGLNRAAPASSLTNGFRRGGPIIFYRHRSHARLAAAANVSAMHSPRSGVAVFEEGGLAETPLPAPDQDASDLASHVTLVDRRPLVTQFTMLRSQLR